jgi:hypothetical protein
MPLSPEEQALLENMRQRELHLKRKQRAADVVLFKERRFRASLLTASGIFMAVAAAFLIFVTLKRTLERVGWEPLALVVIALCVLLGVQVARGLLRTPPGKHLVALRERQLRERYADELNSGQRWTQFYYDGEDIAPYASQVLYLLESDQRFDSVAQAIAFAKESRRANPHFAERARKRFELVAADTNLLVLSTVDANGRPASRLMRFVKTANPGVWYISTTPFGSKITEFDGSGIAIVTVPTSRGSAITTNRVAIRRASVSFADVAELFESQIPGYYEGMTDVELDRELVYELTLITARVDTWLDHEVVEFNGGY